MAFFSLLLPFLLLLSLPLSLCTPTPISECQRLSVGGEFYLTRNLTNATSLSACLSFVTTDPVTLDGQGHSISVSVSALDIRDAAGVVVQNLIVVGSGVGIHILRVPSVQILNVNISGARQGIVVYNTSSVTLTENVVEANAAAVLVSRANYALIEHNIFRGNGVLMDNIILGYIFDNRMNHSSSSSTGVNCVVGCGVLNLRDNILISTVRGAYGFELQGTSLTIANNQINRYNIGISVRGVTASSTTLLETNSVQQFNGSGIVTYLTYATIRNNFIGFGRGEGIYHESPDFGVMVDGNTLLNITSDPAVKNAAIKVHGQFSIIKNNVIQHTRGIMSLMLFQAASHTVQNNLMEYVDLSSQSYSIYSLYSSVVFENNVIREITHSSCDLATVVNFQTMQGLSINNCIFFYSYFILYFLYIIFIQ